MSTSRSHRVEQRRLAHVVRRSDFEERPTHVWGAGDVARGLPGLPTTAPPAATPAAVPGAGTAQAPPLPAQLRPAPTVPPAQLRPTPPAPPPRRPARLRPAPSAPPARLRPAPPAPARPASPAPSRPAPARHSPPGPPRPRITNQHTVARARTAQPIPLAPPASAAAPVVAASRDRADTDLDRLFTAPVPDLDAALASFSPPVDRVLDGLVPAVDRAVADLQVDVADLAADILADTGERTRVRPRPTGAAPLPPPPLAAVPVHRPFAPVHRAVATAVEPQAPRPTAGRRRFRRAAVAIAVAVLLASVAALPAVRSEDAALPRQGALADTASGLAAIAAVAGRGPGVATPAPTSIEAMDLAPASGVWRNIVWYHPLAGPRQLPHHAGRRFGAPRESTADDRPRECGDGHCGVDIGHFRGQIVHAAAAGTVDRVRRRTRDNAGRYVRIRHDGGVRSYYMHLDEVRDDLRKGMRVNAGEPLGTVGRSGILRAPAHLHFALTVDEDGDRRYANPEPVLERAIVLQQPAPLPLP